MAAAAARSHKKFCRMLGFYFCPRLRDFPDRRLASIEPPALYGDLVRPIFGRRIRTDVIREHWNDVVVRPEAVKTCTMR